MTKYRVFQKVQLAEDHAATWDDIGEFGGHDAKAAISAAILEMSATDQETAASSTFAATPAGSWRELSPSVKTETRVSFS